MGWTTEDRAAADLATSLFAGLGEVSVRRMFGGAGVYLDGLIFAIIHEGAIYLKGDAELAAAFAAKGCRQFAWTSPKRGRAVRMNYWTLPEAALDDADEACVWARKALEVARRSRK